MSGSNDNKPPSRLNRKWGFIALLCGLPFFFLFAFIGDDPGRGRAAAICVAIIVAAARARWDLKEHVWFWMTLTIMVAIDVPLVLFIPWTSQSYPGVTLLPIAVADYTIVYGCIKLAEKAMKRA